MLGVVVGRVLTLNRPHHVLLVGSKLSAVVRGGSEKHELLLRV